MGQHSEAELNRKFIETAKLMNIYLNHFPQFEKYALAQQIRVCMYLAMPAAPIPCST